MTTLDELTPKVILNEDAMHKAANSMVLAARCRFVAMYRDVMSMPPSVARELAFTTKILQLTLEYRAAMPDDPRLPQETP